MKNNYSKWKDSEVIKLFNFIEECKNKNIALTKAFNRYAIFSNRKSNSVRNYYYAELGELEKNKQRREKLNINLNKHIKQKFKEFTKQEEVELAEFIMKNKLSGKSVRSSCLKLAKGDVDKMIRYQNKYRSLIKQKKEIIEEISLRLGVKSNNVLSFPKSNKSQQLGVTDEEIKNLFLGLVRLVKKNAIKEANENLKQECNFANESLRKTLVNMSSKQKEIIKLTENNKDLKSKINELENKIKQLRTSDTKIKNSKL